LAKPIFLAPWAVVALTFKFVIGYFVCVDSASIILESANVHDAVINSVAITFLAEINEPYWHFVYSVFHLTAGTDGDDSLQLSFDDVWEGEDRKLNKKSQKKSFMPRMTEQIAGCFPFLTRAGGAAVMEDMVPFFMIFMVYIRGIFVISQAFDTGVLPAVRDVCTVWRWQNHGATFWVLPRMMFVFFEDHLSIINVRNKTELLVAKMGANFTEPCSPGGEFFRLVTSDYPHLIRKYPFEIWSSMSLVMVVLLGHRISSFIFWRLRR